MKLKKLPIEKVLVVLNDMTTKGDIFDKMKSIQGYTNITSNNFVAIHSSAIISENPEEYDFILIEGSSYTHGTDFENTIKALSHLPNFFGLRRGSSKSV